MERDVPESTEQESRTWSDESAHDSGTREAFDETYQRFLVAEFPREYEDGSETTVRAYELIIDPSDQRERRGLLVNFGLRAVASGYVQALGPVVFRGVAFRDQRGELPLDAVYFFLERLTEPGQATQ